VYKFEGRKVKEIKVKAGVTIGPERRRSRRCRAVERSQNVAATPNVAGADMRTLAHHQSNCLACDHFRKQIMYSQ